MQSQAAYTIKLLNPLLKSFLNSNLYPSLFSYWIQTFNALIQLSRQAAIFELSASNGSVYITLNYECRLFIMIEDKNQNHFPYLVLLPTDFRNDTSCFERNYEVWEPTITYWHNIPTICVSTFQGKKCSMMLFLSILLPSVKIWEKQNR